MKNTLLYLLLLTVLFSCKSNGFLMAKAQVTMFQEAYPKKHLDAQIDIYKTKQPDRDFIEFAEISCGDTNQEWALKQIKIKARQIGADGLIIIGKSGNYGTGSVIGNTAYGASRGYGIKVIAIKYK